MKHLEQTTQGGLGVIAFEVILRAEQPLSTRLALALRDCAQTVETTGDRTEESLLPLHIRGHGPEQRRLSLIGAIGPTKPLDSRRGVPAGFQEKMKAPLLILGAKVGVIGAARPARIREDQDFLLAVHEGLGLATVRRGGAGFHAQSRAVGVILANDAPRPAGNFGDLVGSVMLDQLVKRRLDGRESAKAFHQGVTLSHGLLTDEGLTILIDGARTDVAVFIRVFLEQRGREGMDQIVHHILPRGHVHLNVVPFSDRDVFQSAGSQGLSCADQLDHRGHARSEALIDRRDDAGHLHRA